METDYEQLLKKFRAVQPGHIFHSGKHAYVRMLDCRDSHIDDCALQLYTGKIIHFSHLKEVKPII